MKKLLSGALAFAMCFSVLLFTVACGDDNGSSENGNTTVIDFDTGEYSAKDYFSVETSTSSKPITKSTFLSDFVQYSSTGTVTVKIEPISAYRMKLDNVYFDVTIYVGLYPSNQEWKFTEGGNEEREYQSKTITTYLSANGTATITENLKLSFILGKFESLTFNETSLNTPYIFMVSLSNPHGKITLYNN